ncbi:MAG TPA: transglycosylase domain-containing protein, partial [Sphingomonas sp.]|nr:transglycosylase domain-containing protein [Sphingomonas sp.]
MDATLPKQWLETARADLREGWSKRWFRWASYAAGGLILLWAIIWFGVARALPDANQLLNYEPPLPTNVRGINGEPIHSYARERRVEIAFEDFPKPVIAAFLSAEDKNFFKHGGVDYFGIVRAVFNNATSSGRSQGASTITQQVAKNLLVGSERSYVRKAKEALLAYRIEDVLTKQQILELYLNQIPLGRTSFGVQAASRAYFDKDLNELTLSEAAFLATLPKAPETYGRAKFADRAIARRDYVLNEMLANGYIDQRQHDAAMAQPLGILPRIVRRQSDATGYFVEEVRRSLIAKYGETADAGSNSVYAGGLWVRTSFDPKLQTYAQEALRDGLLRYARGQGWSGPLGHVDADDKTLSRFIGANVGIAYDNWRTAVVLSKEGGEALLGFQNGANGPLPASSAQMPRKGTGTPAFNFLKPGDIIAVAPEGDHFALRSVPEVAGAFVVENPHTGQVLAMQGGFDSRLAAFNRATQAQRQPGSSFKPVVYSAALDHGFTPATLIVDGPFCVYQGANLGNKCFRNFGNMRGAGPQTMRWG